MPTEAWLVDGVDLSHVAYDITTRDGMDIVPAAVGENLAFAQTHGEKWTRKYFGPARKQLTMWVSSKDRVTGEEGGALDQQRENLDDNLDYLVRLFSRRNKLLEVIRTMSSGQQRYAKAEVISEIDPMLVGLSHTKFAVDLAIPSGFWRDLNSSTLIDTTPGSNQVAVNMADATAPMMDCEFHITGPATNPRVTDLESGSWFQYNGTVADLTTLVVDNTTMSVTGGSIADMVHDGEVNWLTFYPTINGVTFDFTASAATASTRLQVIGRKAFLR